MRKLVRVLTVATSLVLIGTVAAPSAQAQSGGANLPECNLCSEEEGEPGDSLVEVQRTLCEDGKMSITVCLKFKNPISENFDQVCCDTKMGISCNSSADLTFSCTEDGITYEMTLEVESGKKMQNANCSQLKVTVVIPEEGQEDPPGVEHTTANCE